MPSRVVVALAAVISARHRVGPALLDVELPRVVTDGVLTVRIAAAASRPVFIVEV